MQRLFRAGAAVAASFYLAAAGADGHTGFGDGLAAFMAPNVTESLLLDGVRIGDKIVLVGERGHIIVSTDDGRTWTQSAVPTRSPLTGVTFVDAQHGWAVGHDAVVLRTVDGGTSWERVHFEPDWQTPLLDVWFADTSRGIAVGAYGLYLETRDGGVTWTRRPFVSTPLSVGDDEEGDEDDAEASDDEDEFDDDWEEEVDPEFGEDYHLNHITDAPGGKLYIAGEAGRYYRSDDGGKTWLSLETPYEGSYFATLPLDADTLLLMGMRGNLFRSEDAGLSFEPLDTGVLSLLTAAFRDGDRIVIVGLAGTVLESTDGGQSFELYRQEDRLGNMMALPTVDGGLLLLGEGGVRRLSEADYRRDTADEGDE